MKSSRNIFKMMFAALVLAIFSPSSLFACAACGSGNPNINSPLATGMNWGIFTLLGVVVTMLASIATFFVFIIRREAQFNAQSQKPAEA